MSADLHVHTTFSDGEDTPEEVVDKAAKAELKTIAITDHDVVDGIYPAEVEGQKKNVAVIPGIEFTTEARAAEIHILGYFIDRDSLKLQHTLKKIQESRKHRIFKIVEKLKRVGVPLEAADVFAFATGVSAGRPHVARAMIKKEFVKNIKEAFEKYLGWGKPAYEPHYKLTPPEAIALILETKGVPVLAHPATSKSDEMIPDLIIAGLRGIEVYYPSHSKSAVDRYLNIAKKNNLVITGGSDYHGENSNRAETLGGFSIPDRLVKKLADARG
jgi:predicted metal-dependent phosphoesterase TrpH